MTDKAILNEFTERSLIDLYTTIAGLTSGYISVVMRDFKVSKEEAQKWMLEVDQKARDKVAGAFHIYDEMKDRERGEE